MKKWALILTFSMLLPLALNAWATEQTDSPSQRLRQDISNLKEKIRGSKNVRSKDIQRLTELENQLHKSQFLNSSPQHQD